MNNKVMYETPEMEIINLENEDIMDPGTSLPEVDLEEMGN